MVNFRYGIQSRYKRKFLDLIRVYYRCASCSFPRKNSFDVTTENLGFSIHFQSLCAFWHALFANITHQSMYPFIINLMKRGRDLHLKRDDRTLNASRFLCDAHTTQIWTLYFYNDPFREILSSENDGVDVRTQSERAVSLLSSFRVLSKYIRKASRRR